MTYWLVYHKTPRQKRWRLCGTCIFSHRAGRFVESGPYLFRARRMARINARWQRESGRQARVRKLVVNIPESP